MLQELNRIILNRIKNAEHIAYLGNIGKYFFRWPNWISLIKVEEEISKIDLIWEPSGIIKKENGAFLDYDLI